MGQAEHSAKTDRDEAAIEKLQAELAKAIKKLTPLLEADSVSAIPPARGKSWDLPSELAKRIAESCGKLDLSSAASFAKDKQSVTRPRGQVGRLRSCQAPGGGDRKGQEDYSYR